ncbi:MAG TPA: glycosyltransferase [Thermoanaerobaculia bacterium]|nr:glycosyltransferase [Thermoanaerobaculia bacterium]
MNEAAAQTEREPRNDSPRVRTAIAVLMMRFPRIDETFILREIVELERVGQPVLVVPLLHGDTRVVHEEARPWVKRALYTPLFSAAIAGSNAAMFLRAPLRYLRLLFGLIAAGIIRPSTLIRTLALFPKCVHLARVLPRMGIRHVHAHFASHATTAAYIMSSLSDITYSFTVHGPDVFVHRVLLREKIARAKFVRAISTFNKAFLCGLYPVLTESKVEVVHSGVNPDVYAEGAVQPHDGARIRLISVAALTPQRGFPFLIEACARLAKAGLDFDCNIVGSGPLLETTRHWIADHGLADRVHLLGPRPQHEVAQLMREADIFVLPSIIATDGQMDGIPLSLMEAMAAGKPVVASSISGIPELVTSEVSGILVDAAYPGKLADAVLRLAADPALRDRLGRAGQVKVRRDFHIHRTAEQLVSLLDRQGHVNDVQPSTADRVRSLRWSRLGTVAVGVRKVHELADAFVAEVAISDGVNRKDAIVRRPRASADESESALDRARAEFEVLSTLRQTMGPENAYTVPRLLMFDEPNAALVLERADGKSLAAALTAGNLFKAGTWLRLMQSNTRGDGDGRYVLTAVVVLAQRHLDLVSAGDRVIAARREAIVDRLRELETRLAQKETLVVGQHGSFAPRNIFIGERRVDVVDFGSYREGLPMEDVAEMLLHVERPELRTAFLDGWGGTVDEDALRLFTITRALRMLARGGVDSARRAALRKVIARAMS